jgi:hypothetical protein
LKRDKKACLDLTQLTGGEKVMQEKNKIRKNLKKFRM